MVKMSQRLVSESIIAKLSYGRKNQKRYITIHETGNVRAGANADMHARLQSSGNSRTASWHWQVDDQQAIQSFSHDISCWHGGDGKNGTGNLHSIAIEICINSDGDYKKAVQNAIELTRYIMQQENIPLKNVVQHNLWSKKDCPTYLRNGAKGINWSQFMDAVNQPVSKEEVTVAKVVEEYERDAKPSPTLAEEVDRAIKAGITDGTYLKRPATREETAVMVLRAFENHQ